MSREEQYTRWVLKERRRLEDQRERRELLNMRVVEEQQRAVERELRLAQGFQEMVATEQRCGLSHGARR